MSTRCCQSLSCEPCATFLSARDIRGGNLLASSKLLHSFEHRLRSVRCPPSLPVTLTTFRLDSHVAAKEKNARQNSWRASTIDFYQAKSADVWQCADKYSACKCRACTVDSRRRHICCHGPV